MPLLLTHQPFFTREMTGSLIKDLQKPHRSQYLWVRSRGKDLWDQIVPLQMALCTLGASGRAGHLVRDRAEFTVRLEEAERRAFDPVLRLVPNWYEEDRTRRTWSWIQTKKPPFERVWSHMKELTVKQFEVLRMHVRTLALALRVTAWYQDAQTLIPESGVRGSNTTKFQREVWAIAELLEKLRRDPELEKVCPGEMKFSQLTWDVIHDIAHYHRDHLHVIFIVDSEGGKSVDWIKEGIVVESGLQSSEFKVKLEEEFKNEAMRGISIGYAHGFRVHRAYLLLSKPEHFKKYFDQNSGFNKAEVWEALILLSFGTHLAIRIYEKEVSGACSNKGHETEFVDCGGETQQLEAEKESIAESVQSEAEELGTQKVISVLSRRQLRRFEAVVT